MSSITPPIVVAGRSQHNRPEEKSYIPGGKKRHDQKLELLSLRIRKRKIYFSPSMDRILTSKIYHIYSLVATHLFVLKIAFLNKN